MKNSNLWVLPDGVQELNNALPLENLRRSILDLFKSYGYELVLPPLLEFLDTLLIGKGDSLELETIKITDQASGRLLGLRADITPQIARIASRSKQTRFCYVGDSAKALSVHKNRIPKQIGAELFACDSLDGDIEIINLMLKTLSFANIKNIYLDIGHVGIFRKLVKSAKLDNQQEQSLVAVLQKKSKKECIQLLKQFKTNTDIAQMILSLIDLHGDKDILDEASKILDIRIVGKYLQELKQISKTHSNIHFDLSELRGYSYHTGLVFAAFCDDFGRAIAKGGRYDNVCKIFGKNQSATGFSTDLLDLLKFGKIDKDFEVIFAPKLSDEKLQNKIQNLRKQGLAVLCELTGKEKEHCSHQLKFVDDEWQVYKR